jgi:mono/diheme cytochrome c family protein
MARSSRDRPTGASRCRTAKHGLVPPYAPPGYQSDMPGFAATLTDAEIRAVLAYIASHWSGDVRKARAEMLQHRP